MIRDKAGLHYKNMRQVAIGLLIALSSLAAQVQSQDKLPKPAKPGEVVLKLAEDVEAVESLVTSEHIRKWLGNVRKLPTISPSKVLLKEKEVAIDEAMFYSAKYGSPLAYARALDLAVSAGYRADKGSRIFDFGYGSIGHLRMLALDGHDCVGVDVAPLLKIMYANSSGPLGDGSVHVLDGYFPKDLEIVEKVGNDFDLFLSKNVLKRGYIHPTRDVSDPRMLIDLGVDDEQFLSRVANMLKPNGLFVIYNFCPPKSPANKPYIPWSEGESPFTREAFEGAGLEVLHLDVVDDIEARRFGHALGWDKEGGMNLESDLFAWYTIARKRPVKQSVAP
jgi:hypothetical protein